MLKSSLNHRVNKAPATMVRVVWSNSECGDVVKHYKAKGLQDCKLMRGFFIKEWSVVPPVAYSK